MRKLNLTASLCCLLIAGCHSQEPNIEITVPKGFTGSIWILQDESAPDLQYIDGKYRIAISSNRVFRVRTFSQFERFHKLSALSGDGIAIPSSSSSSRLDPDIIALRGGQSGVTLWGGREYYFIKYFVGTEGQTIAFLEKLEPPPDPGQ
jgi:hypothetical protein